MVADHPGRFGFFMALPAGGAFEPAERAAIDRGNAARLFPRFA
jgi:hypothetical protein